MPFSALTFILLVLPGSSELNDRIHSNVSGGFAVDVPVRIVPELEFADTIHLLLPGLFHGEDMNAAAGGLDWYGLYMRSDHCEVSAADISLEPAFDPILDSEGQATARNVKVVRSANGLGADSLVCLISGIDLPDGLAVAELLSCMSVGSVSPGPALLLPGETLRINADWELVTFGQAAQGHRVVLRNNEGKRMQVAAAEWLDDTNMALLWAGDLNADGIPDLLLDVSHKYSYSHLVLYLSDRNSDPWITRTAEFRFTGC